MGDQLQLLLTEFRAFRDTEWREFRESVSAWQQETGERVAQLEVKAQDLSGNGQPGRMTIAEQGIAALQRVRYWQLGAAAALSGALTLVLHYLLPRMRY
ncbi:MAG: hypothetical protein P4M04_00655 [Acidobacteriota bacterium]|nr:hypothetical protein [Acidobacteriota bacterium]